MVGEWTGWRVAISGLRDLHPEDEAKVEEAILALAQARPSLVILGGARGTDTLALRALLASGLHQHLLVMVPGTLADQPSEARDAIEENRARLEVRELGLSVSDKRSYLARNRAMLDEADALLAFSDGSSRGGTAYTIGEARRRGLAVEVVRVRRAG